MASAIYTPSFCCSTYVRNIKPAMYSLAPCSCSCSYSSLNSCLKTPKFLLSSRFSHMGSCHFTPWNGLRHMGISISPKSQKIGRRENCKGKVVYASLFGVGAPEALVIGVVALLVFGPKGLAEVARNLGKTLRTFQPTIRELQEVSREFKSTLEREISLDDDPRSMSNTYGSSPANTSDQSVYNVEKSQTESVADPNGISSNNAYSSEEYLKITEEQLKASTAEQQDSTSSPPESQIEIGSQSQDSSPPNSAYSSEDSLKITGEQLEASETTQQDVASPLPESQIEVENQIQAAVQETATAVPPAQKTETD